MQEKKFHSLSNNMVHWITTIKSVRIDRTALQLTWQNYRTGFFLWLVFALFLALIQFSVPDMPDNDGYYHIKLAYLMRNEGLKPLFTWIPLSILNPREFYDHHFLFHVALIPFTFGDLRIGAKLAAVLFASLAFVSTWSLLKNQRVPYAAFWALGLMAVSEAFIYRMSITRAQSLSLVVLMLGLDWLLRKKFYRLAVLAFFYVWLYDAFPLLLIFAGVFVLAVWVMERKLDLRPLLTIGIGTGLGLLINPYFPHNIVFAIQHILPKLFETTSVSVGNEWYPYDTAQLLRNSHLALAAFVGGALALGFNEKRMDLRTLVSFLLAGLFGVMLFQSRRFIEYFPPFALIFAAFAFTPILRVAPFRVRNLSLNLSVLAMILVLVPGVLMTFSAARSSMQSSKPYQTYAAASAWLTANTDAGVRVFQTDWDDFPRLFYYNTHNTYLIGLDPTYMLIYDADLYHQWVEITQGKVNQPSAAIKQEFGSSYVITDLRHQDFLKQAANDPGLVEMYRDGDAVVFQVSPQQKK
jgi:hypothetical protein